MEPTRVDKTEKGYLSRANGIVSRYIRDSGQTLENIEALIDWLLTVLQPTIVKSTWRYDRAAIAFYLQHHNHSFEVVSAVKKLENRNCKAESFETSALKQKKLSDNDIELIASKLNSVKNKWDGLLLCWLEAAVVTGLRPSEWETVLLKGDYLIVQNAKNTNGRSFGVERILNLSNLKEHHYEAIEKFLHKLHYGMRVNDGDFEFIYTSCRMRLRRITAKLWPLKKKHPTLYSGRHQFCADMKNTLSMKQIAALMGHGTDATATEHYGKKRVGIKRENHIFPDPEQVALIREIRRGQKNNSDKDQKV
jgi:hypothetical protein